MSKEPDVDRAIAQMTSVDKFIACLMLAEKICFHGKTPRFYRNEETIRKMCPPKVRQFFSFGNLRRLGVAYQVPKTANLYALPGFGIRVAKKLYETGEAKKVYELYGGQYVPL